MMPDLSMSHERMSDFVSFPLCALTFVIKMRDLDFKLHLNTLIFFYQKKLTSDLNMSHGKMSSFVPFPLLVLNFVIKVRDLHFKPH